MAEPVRDFALDANGFVDISGGALHFVAGEAAAEQGIGVKIKMVLGECWLDEGVGTDWETILDKGTDPDVVRAIVAQRIAAVPDVTTVVGADVQVDPSTREAEVDYEVTTKYSTKSVTGQIGAP